MISGLLTYSILSFLYRNYYTVTFRLADLDLELDTLKRQVDDLRTENEWLQNEAEKTKEESVSVYCVGSLGSV